MQWSKGEYRDNGLKNDAIDFCNIVLFYRSSCIILYEIHCCCNCIISNVDSCHCSAVLRTHPRLFPKFKSAHKCPHSPKPTPPRSTHSGIRDRERYGDNGLKNEAVDFCNIVLFYRSSCIISYEIHCCSNCIITQTVIAFPSSLHTQDFFPYKKANMPQMGK